MSHPGPYSLVLEYASEVDAVQNVNILDSSQSGGLIPARANIYSCAYRCVVVASAIHTFRIQVFFFNYDHYSSKVEEYVGLSQLWLVLTLAAFCAGVLQWTAGTKLLFCSFLTR